MMTMEFFSCLLDNIYNITDQHLFVWMMTSLEKINTPSSNSIIIGIEDSHSLNSNFMKRSMCQIRFFLLAAFSKDLVFSTGNKNAFIQPTLI